MNSLRRNGRIAAILAAVALCGGCGSESDSGPAGASVAPTDTQLFLSVATDFQSAQWEAAEDLLDEFPDGDRAVEFLLRDLGLEDVDFGHDIEPALGPETDVVGLDLSGDGEFVGLTQPDDAQKLSEILSALDPALVTREVGGWTAFAESEAVLDQFESAREAGTLAGSEDYEDAIAETDHGALVQLYVNGSGLQATIEQEEEVPAGAFSALFPGGRVPSLALSLAAEDNGVRLQGAAQLGEGEGGIVPDNFAAELPAQVPSGALLYVGFNDLESSLSSVRDFLAEVEPDFDRDLARLEAAINVSLEEDVFPLFAGEGALYVRPGLFLPEITLVTEVEDEEQALGTVEQLVTAASRRGIFAPPRQLQIDDVPVVEMSVEGAPVSLFYAAFDGHLVVTTSRGGIAGLRAEGDRLADDSGFRDALEEAGVPDETVGFTYVNLKDAIPFALTLSDSGGDANLEPLESLVVYGARGGQTLHLAGFLRVD